MQVPLWAFGERRCAVMILGGGGGLLGGGDPLSLLGADVVDRGGQLAKAVEVVAGDGGAVRLGVEGPHGTFEEGVQLFVVEGGDVLGKRELFHGAGVQMIDLGDPAQNQRSSVADSSPLP